MRVFWLRMSTPEKVSLDLVSSVTFLMRFVDFLAFLTENSFSSFFDFFGFLEYNLVLGWLRWPEGHVYTGEFLNDKPHGFGWLKMANGDSYKGSFVEGQRHGTGTLEQ